MTPCPPVDLALLFIGEQMFIDIPLQLIQRLLTKRSHR